MGTREVQQVVTWRAAGSAYLSIETTSSPPRILWQTDRGKQRNVVDSIKISDLDSDGIPEIISVWRSDGTTAAAIRVFHWNRDVGSFVDVPIDNQIDRIAGYSIVRAPGRQRTRRLRVYSPSAGAAGAQAGVDTIDYELRLQRIGRVRQGGAVTAAVESGIEGRAVISPIRPGPARQGQPDTVGFKTTLVVWRAADGIEVTRFETGPDGRFRVALAPGLYKIGQNQQTGRLGPRAGEQAVTVLSGQFVSVEIHFDSGIR
jgi:hypothetical protein